MKVRMLIIILMVSTLAISSSAKGLDDDIGSDVGLFLDAVAEVVEAVKNTEQLEESLNDSNSGINNLDLDGNGEIDYLRVEEKSAEDTRLVVLQAVVGENEIQDVATIAFERVGEVNNFQVQGAQELYGENYYVVSRSPSVSGWSFVRWLFRANYTPYRSRFGWKVYPTWWRIRTPRTSGSYYTYKLSNFNSNRRFGFSRTMRVRSVSKVRYTSRNSRLVRKKRVVRRRGNKKIVTKKGVKTTRNNANGRKTVTRKGVRTTTNRSTGVTTRTTVKKKTVKTKKGKKTKVKKVKVKKKN